MEGWGGVLNSLLPAHGFWRRWQRRCHITLLELKAVRFTVEAFLAELRGKAVLHWCDNQAVMHVLTNVTSRSPEMMKELRKLWRLLDSEDITLRTRYIRSAANVWADRLFRRENQDDWMLGWKYFDALEERFGPHTVERFATPNNTHLARFNSEFHAPGTEGVNALAQSWLQENNFVNPPWFLLDKVARNYARKAQQRRWWRRTAGRDMVGAAQDWRRTSFVCHRHGFVPSRSAGLYRERGPPAWDVVIFRVPGRPVM